MQWLYRSRWLIVSSLGVLLMFVGNGVPANSANEGFQAPPKKDAVAEAVATELAKIEASKPPRARTLGRLDEPVSLNFPEDTPLRDVLKYIKDATQGPNDSGIPIYIDPYGLADAEQTKDSPVNINLDGIPLSTTLGLVLKQLGLAYFVQKDGVLFITSEDRAEAESDPNSKILKELAAIREDLAAIKSRLLAIEAGASKDGTIDALKAELEILMKPLKPKEIVAPAVTTAPKPPAPKPKP